MRNNELVSEPLLDRYGRSHTYLRISLTDRCNFRCQYCMPAELMKWQPRDELLTFDEIERLASIFVHLGTKKIRLTGGEPTVRQGIVDLVGRLSAFGGVDELCMTTNAYKLTQLAAPLRAAGLSSLNISLDTLSPRKFASITRRDVFPSVLEGIDAARSANYKKIKINVVVMSGVNDDELCDFVAFCSDRKVELRFIEFMPFQGNEWEEAKVFPVKEMLSRIRTKYTLVPAETEPSAVATEFIAEELGLRVGFIGSMTEPFCSTCNRVRLTSDGQVKNCLFDKREVNLRDIMRAGATDAELETAIRGAILEKWRGHPHMSMLKMVDNRPMVSIGG